MGRIQNGRKNVHCTGVQVETLPAGFAGFGSLWFPWATGYCGRCSVAFDRIENPQLLSEPDENCMMCHSDPDFKGTFQNGESISLYVEAGEYEQSVHGPAGLNCVACHTER